jgi:serine/threonine protein kinase
VLKVADFGTAMNVGETQGMVPALQVALISACSYTQSQHHGSISVARAHTSMAHRPQVVGSVDYIAPEVVHAAREENGSYNGYLADLWSCGVIL